MKYENLIILLTPIILIFMLSVIDFTDENNTHNNEKQTRDSEIVKADPQEKADQQQESEPELEKQPQDEKLADTSDIDSLQASYDEIQKEEESAFQEKIEKKWGEYKTSSQKEWLSYSENQNIRRSVNYETGEVTVEALMSPESMVPENVKKLLEKETRNFLNITEAQAFKSDEISQNVEKRLPDNNETVARSKPSDHPLFNVNEMPPLSFNYSGFVKVSASSKTLVNARIRKSKIKNKVIAQTKLKLDERVLRKTSQYAKILKIMANKQKISPALVYAIIETESNFNPMAKSNIPAFGLMQIVPRTAGKDATKHLWGKPKVLAPSYLYSSINNIQIGTAYLHVLYYKYLRKVKNSQSRAYLAIAAYNTGTTNVARAFVRQKNFNRATRKINKLSSNKVYRTLVKRLPFRETRRYVKKVTKAMNHYWTMQQQNVI